jgi:hypothetical protein
VEVVTKCKNSGHRLKPVRLTTRRDSRKDRKGSKGRKVPLTIQIFARRDDFGQKRQQGLKPLGAAMIAGTTEVVP